MAEYLSGSLVTASPSGFKDIVRLKRMDNTAIRPDSFRQISNKTEQWPIRVDSTMTDQRLLETRPAGLNFELFAIAQRFGRSMEIGGILRLSLPLCLIGFVTTLFATLSIAGVLSADGTRIYLSVLYGVLGILSAFLSWWRNAVVLSRVTFLILAFLDIASAFAAPSVSWAFQDNANYVNRVTYFMFLEIALLGSVAVHWHFLTGLVGGPYVEQAGLEAPQESFLYFIWALIVGFVVPWFIPLKESYYRDVVFKAAVVDTLGWWFFGGLLAAGFGILILFQGGGGKPSPGISTGASKDSSYETVG
jgi:hypothetical protein